MVSTQGDRRFYVYIHKTRDEGQVFYVGKGARDRIARIDSRSEHWLNIVSKHGFVGEKVKSDMLEPCALSLERMVIAKYGRDRLCNKTDGGVGSSGYTHSAQSLERMSALKKGVRKVLSAESRAQASERIRQSKLGVPLSKSHRESLRLAHLGKTLPVEHRRKIAEANLGANHPRHDRTVYNISHEKLGEASMSRYEIMSCTGASRSMVSMFINGKVKSCKGWSFV